MYIPVTGATTPAAEITDPAGTYTPLGASAPITDGAGTYSLAGARTPTADPGGTYSAAGASAPIEDPAGTDSSPVRARLPLFGQKLPPHPITKSYRSVA